MDKENGADGRARDHLGEVRGSRHVVLHPFQNKVLTKGTVYTKYIYGNKIDSIIFTRRINITCPL